MCVILEHTHFTHVLDLNLEQQEINPCVNIVVNVQNVCNLRIHTLYTCFTPELRTTGKQSMCKYCAKCV